MFRVIWKIMFLGVIMLAVVFQGCAFEEGDTIVVDDSAPAAPRGVYSITGDGQVTVEWYPNQEKDLKGYIIYRSNKKDKDFVEIDTVGAEADRYVDDSVRNGNTYYYAVSAIDVDNNESELSPETVEDTPRPAGKNVRLTDSFLDPDRSGFDLANPGKGAQRFDKREIDIYFGVDLDVRVPYIYSDNETSLQDLGYTDSMDDIDVSPQKGFTTLFVEAIIGHTYTFLTPDGNYAKIRITDIYIDWVGDQIRDAWITFDWAYQLQTDNPELAPKKG